MHDIRINPRQTTLMLKRLLALMALPSLSILFVAGIAWWNRRTALAEGNHPYPVEVDVALMLAPTVVLYLLSLPFVWRALRGATARTLTLFSIGTFALAMVGLIIAFGPLHQLAWRYDPDLADRAFYVLPFAPIVVALCVAVLVTRRRYLPPTPRL
ncbi:MAG: hypothetical protein IT353_24680 [Gemmatimonadaceae bacterium]|nr:hypothetical protein [Gemmatimonadaceae bacterium]